MNRNVTIVVVILVLVVIVGYLVWLRSRYQSPVSPQVQEQLSTVPSVSPQQSSPSASPAMKEATGSMKDKGATSSSTKK